jgi:Fur family ferric uptake transcriptional regulator
LSHRKTGTIHFLDWFQKKWDLVFVATSSELRERLKRAGLRVTGPRLAVLAWLRVHPHTTAEQVAGGVRELVGAVSTQAVYDVLNVFSDANLVRRIEPAGHPARYETRIADEHHHIVCRVCGRTEDVDTTVGVDECLTPTASAGFVIDSAEVVFWGLCPDCELRAESGAERLG